MKLNLGGGGQNPPGYIDVDRQTGQEIYPLDYPDCSASIIRASHCLEHFSHRKVGDVVKEWARVLAPGGVIRIAVPDFAKVIQWFVEKRFDLPLHSYVMGGQDSEDDYHKCLFNEGLLRKVMIDAGLVDIKTWESELSDNASLEVSLNLQGKKPETNWVDTIEPYNIYSQFGEDAYLDAIFAKIGIGDKPYCVDVGAADGLMFSNVRQWIEKHWYGLLIEKDGERFKQLAVNTAQYSDRVRCFNYEVTPTGQHRLDELLRQAKAPVEFDLLSIDIDGQDYYIWNSLLSYTPRVVVVEYSPESDEMFIPQLGGQGQAGSKAMRYVAAARGYLTVKQTETNLICIRRDVFDKHFNVTGTVEQRIKAPALADMAGNEFKVPESVEPPLPVPSLDRKLNVTAVVSLPRLGINANWHCTIQALLALGLKIQMVEGVFWGACLTRGIQQALDEGADVILTIDYDSVFTPEHVIRLLQLLGDQEEFDCIVPVQIKRESNVALFQTNGDKDFTKELTNIATGHFGLTVFDARAFAKLPKPWFQGQPNSDGEWGDGRIDDDIWFWQQWRKAGLKLASANKVKIGHIEFVVTWATNDFRIYRQSISEYRRVGQPAQCGGHLQVELMK